MVADPKPDGTPDTWRVHRAVLASLPAGASHLLALQDDALPCQQFASKLLAAIDEKPNELLALFVPGFGFMRRRLLEAKQAGEQFAVLPQVSFVPLVAVVYPREIVERLQAWAESAKWPNAGRTLHGADDGIVALFTRAHRMRVWATVPCLVDHRTDVPSIAKPTHTLADHRRAAML